MFTKEEVIRFYEGDVNGNDGFWSDAKAYVTWNALLFPGCSTEQARSAENRTLNAAFLDHIDIVEELSYVLFMAMQKSLEELHVCRVERYADYVAFLKYGKLLSFISTSTAGFLNAYQDKKELVLMDITIPRGIRCADFSKLLKHYEKYEEREILLPPFLTFTVENKEMDAQIRSICDRDGNPPVVYCAMNLHQAKYEIKQIDFDASWISAGKRCFAAWNHKQCPKESDIEAYCQLKMWLQNKIQLRMKSEEGKEVQNENQ